jgi:hypothetical protein
MFRFLIPASPFGLGSNLTVLFNDDYGMSAYTYITSRFYLMYDTTEIVFYVSIVSRINLKVFHLYNRTFDLWRAHHQALLIKPNYV